MNKERINNAIKNTNIVRDMFIKMCDNYIDSQKKIDKAIEYLESYNTDFKNTRFGEAPISLRELGDLLDILRGNDNE